jgi:hypothetical protein
MRTVRSLAVVPVLVLLLASCGDDTSTTSTEEPAAVTTVAPATTTLPAITIALPDSTTLDTAVADDASAGEPLSGPVQIDVVVGRDSGPDRIEYVTVGSQITLNITNPDAADEFHVHGIDLEQAADAGQMATLNFTIELAGTYEVESHVTDGVLIVIEAA